VAAPHPFHADPDPDLGFGKMNADLDPDVGLDFSLFKKTCIPNQIFYFPALLIEVQTFIQKVSVLKGAQE